MLVIPHNELDKIKKLLILKNVILKRQNSNPLLVRLPALIITRKESKILPSCLLQEHFMNSKNETQPIIRNETDKLTIIGAGFSGLMAALLAYLEYRAQNKKLRITVIGDQNPTECYA